MTSSSSDKPRNYRVVVIKGDGIGEELVESSLTVLRAVESRLEDFHLDIEFHEGGAGLYEREGTNIAPETVQAALDADVTMKGPAGLPWVRNKRDGTEAGSVAGTLRPALDTYANTRPIRLLPNVPAPLSLKPGDVDYLVVRENTEGLYASRGRSVGNDWAVTDTMLMTRVGVERVVRYAFEQSRKRGTGAPDDGVKRVTCVDKANVLGTFAFFRRIFDEVGEAYPDIQRSYLYADAAAQALVMRPQQFDVLVMENLLGDILSDLGGGTIGGIGLCPSGNVGDHHAFFEPIHGSAPDIAGKDLANPISQVLTLSMLLDYLGEHEASEVISKSVWAVLESGELRIGTNGQPEGGTKAAANVIAEAARTV
ncbi:MAG: isocitrate/isopropylmalate family dehydrogenase [Chloroflexi bacterium]|nr:isocitrate/isopropylmalate family dehydrogenase [Chloroflexota bacterium]